MRWGKKMTADGGPQTAVGSQRSVVSYVWLRAMGWDKKRGHVPLRMTDRLRDLTDRGERGRGR